MANVVNFADGEPIDPIKLNKLQDQILEIKDQASAAYNLSSRNVDNGTQQYVFHTKAGYEEFQKVAPGDQVTSQLSDLEWSGDYESVYTVATPRLKNPKNIDLRISFTGDSRQPTMVVYYNGTAKTNNVIDTLRINWISVAMKPVIPS